MTREDIVKYKFLGDLALKYRLSLENVCRIAGLDVNSENKTELYNIFLSLGYDYKAAAFEYLFTYETVNEKPAKSALARKNAKKFIDSFNVVPRDPSLILKDMENENDEKKLMRLRDEMDAYEELYKEELDYEALKRIIKAGDYKLTLNDFLIIEKYRLKNALSQISISKELDMFRDKINRWEANIEDEELKSRLKDLSDFYLDLHSKNRSK